MRRQQIEDGFRKLSLPCIYVKHKNPNKFQDTDMFSSLVLTLGCLSAGKKYNEKGQGYIIGLR